MIARKRPAKSSHVGVGDRKSPMVGRTIPLSKVPRLGYHVHNVGLRMNPLHLATSFERLFIQTTPDDLWAASYTRPTSSERSFLHAPRDGLRGSLGPCQLNAMVPTCAAHFASICFMKTSSTLRCCDCSDQHAAYCLINQLLDDIYA